MWDLWCAKWQWDKFYSKRFVFHMPTIIPPMLTYHHIWLYFVLSWNSTFELALAWAVSGWFPHFNFRRSCLQFLTQELADLQILRGFPQSLNVNAGIAH